MAYTEEQLNEKTQPELVDIAKKMELAVDPAEEKDLLVSEVMRAQADAAKKPKRTQRKAPAAKKGDDPEERVEVIFHETSGADGSQDIKLALNGEAVKIKRSTPVKVKRKFLHGPVKDAIITENYRDDRGNHRVRNIPRFPYSLA
jgi:hypothetical protein